MSLRVNQSQSDSLIYAYFHTCISTQDVICLLSKLSFTLKLHIASFSKRQRLHDFYTALYPEDFLKRTI